MGYSLRGNFLTCWVCGRKPLAQTLAELTDLPYKECARLVGEFDYDPRVAEKVKGKLVVPKGVGPMKKAHKDYLRRRRFDPDEIAERWSVQGIGQQARLGWRLFIPVVSGGETVSWTTRALSDRATRRYVNADKQEESVNLKSLLYGEDYAKHAVIVHEGPTDVWRTGPGAVCTFGLGYTRSQVLKLSQYPRRVICFDAGREAQRKARELYSLLSGFDGETLRVELSEKDAGETRGKELKALRAMLY